MFEPRIYTASGSQVDVTGGINVLIELGGVNTVTKVILADIDMATIIGLDSCKPVTVR